VAAGHKQGMSLEAWHLSGGPVGSLARWSATSNVEVVQMKSVVGHFIRGAECPRRQMFWWGGGIVWTPDTTADEDGLHD